jgi:hypothetical protein
VTLMMGFPHIVITVPAMADDEYDCIAITALAAVSATISAVTMMRRRNKKRKRSMWVRPMFRLRKHYGAYDLLMAELRTSDEPRFRGFVRLTPDEFNELLNILSGDISGSRRFRKQIPADIKLAITLRIYDTLLQVCGPLAGP